MRTATAVTLGFLVVAERLAIRRIVPGHGPVCGKSAIADNIRSLRGSEDGARAAHRTPKQ